MTKKGVKCVESWDTAAGISTPSTVIEYLDCATLYIVCSSVSFLLVYISSLYNIIIKYVSNVLPFILSTLQ